MSKIAPEPYDIPRASGSPIELTNEDAQEHNLRILSCCFQEEDNSKSWVIPAEDRLPLLFFRRVFTRLRWQWYCVLMRMKSPQWSPTEENGQGEDEEEDACDQAVPIESFQRSFERLFCVLGYEDGFDSQSYDFYDQNSDGFVGWTEFSHVFEKRSFIIKLSLPERIYITLDNPDSSYIAQIVSTFLLFVIVLSSLSFILATSPNFQMEPQGLEKPEPQPSLLIIEYICLIFFLIEYLIRLCTCWAVRTEVVDKEKLLELTIGHESLNLSTPSLRLWRFVTSFSNTIDLVAILPGLIGLVAPGSLEGGGFVVLRLVRLTRIFRAFKNPKLLESVIVIGRAMSLSSKALYLLLFNGFLGILISGSLMYLAEKGDWDPATRTFKRSIGKTWNTTSESWDHVMAESPFSSIPQTFWWTVVTTTTVGYGDVYPTSMWGYTVATLTMVFSLIIGALPVGVIGGNFTQVWQDYTMEKHKLAKQTKYDYRFMTVAMQRIDPNRMSRLLYIEVWNERFPDWNERFRDADKAPRRSRPPIAEFLGQTHLRLRLDNRLEAITETLELKELAEEGLAKRIVTGTITVQYEWIPENEDSVKLNGTLAPISERKTLNGLRGRLKVTLLHAEGLQNVSYAKARRCGANPYCTVFCYPNSPAKDSMLCAVGWRSPNVVGTTSPSWNHTCHFDFCWAHVKAASRTTDLDRSDSILRRSPSPEKSDVLVGPSHCRNNVSQVIRDLGQELKLLRGDLHGLKNRIVRVSFTPEPPAERMD